MKKILPFTLALSIIVSSALPYTTAHASASSETSDNVTVTSVGDSTTTMNYTESVGYYLAQDIPQGLEFIILGEGDFVLAKDIQNGGYYLVEGTNDFSKLSDISEGRLNPVRVSRATRSSFNDPSTPISKDSGSRTLRGVWWGGILDDIGIVGTVAAVTEATTDRTQSKASVKPGTTAAWHSSDWKDTGVQAVAMKDVGISGNKAAWDLRAN